MKAVFATLLTLSGFNVMAADPQVQITSFDYTDNSARIAELCGLVSDAKTFPTFVKVIVDNTSKHPANYNTFAGADGKFCLLVNTFSGLAEVSLP